VGHPGCHGPVIQGLGVRRLGCAFTMGAAVKITITDKPSNKDNKLNLIDFK
jgi:hypothetical protein